MAWPVDDLSNANTNQGTDDPSAARADLDLLITRTKEIIAGRATANGVCDLDAGTLVPVARLPVATVAKGGTGVATVAVQGMLVGNGTSPLQVITAGTSGQLLTSQGSGSPPNWTTQGFAAGTKLWFYQAAAPTGWAIDASTSDAILGVAISGISNGTLGGSWSSNTNGKAISVAQMPAHSHPGSAADSDGAHTHPQQSTTKLETPSNAAGGSQTNEDKKGGTTQSGGAHTHATTVASQGSGSTHSHNMSGWRPKAHSGVICVKS